MALELCLRAAELLTRKGHSRYRSCGSCSYLYEPIPGAEDANSFGLRGPEVSLTPPPGTLRVLVLGDSVTYGIGVGRHDTFSALLPEALGTGQPVEVLNAGVLGYSPYNEVRRYKEKLEVLGSHVVVAQTCLNDIISPELHWSLLAQVPFTVPRDAYPSPDARVPRLNSAVEALLNARIMQRSLLFRGLLTAAFSAQELYIRDHIGSVVNGIFYPTFISAQSLRTFEPLLDYESPEWQWLKAQYDLLLDETRNQGAAMVLMVVPLGYELNPDYPFHPEDNFLRYCQEREIRCLDLRKALAGHTAEEIFQMGGSAATLPDVWHFSPAGHQAVAKIVARFLVEAGFVETNAGDQNSRR